MSACVCDTSLKKSYAPRIHSLTLKSLRSLKRSSSSVMPWSPRCSNKTLNYRMLCKRKMKRTDSSPSSSKTWSVEWRKRKRPQRVTHVWRKKSETKKRICTRCARTWLTLNRRTRPCKFRSKSLRLTRHDRLSDLCLLRSPSRKILKLLTRLKGPRSFNKWPK